MIVQIYEIQTVAEAQKLLALGVDHIGSVLHDQDNWLNPEIKDVVSAVRKQGAKSSLIPLSSSLKAVLAALSFYQPDIIHFCDALIENGDIGSNCQALLELQRGVKAHFPAIKLCARSRLGNRGRPVVCRV